MHEFEPNKTEDEATPVPAPNGELEGNGSNDDELDQTPVSGFIDLQIEEADDISLKLKSLGKSDPIRRLARRILGQNAGSNTDIRPLLQALLRPSDYSWRQQSVAAWTLGKLTLTGDERRAALAMLRQAATYRRSISFHAAILRACCDAWFMGIGAVCVLYWLHIIENYTEAAAIFGAVMAVAAFAAWTASRAHRTRVRVGAIHALRCQPDAGSVDVLAVMADGGPGIIAHSALDALLPALAEIQSAHSGTIPAVALQSLTRLAASFDDSRPAMNEDARLAILRALSCVGDAATMTSLERMARDRRVRKSARVAQAVQTAIGTIAARIERQRGGETLLRPAVSTGGSDTELVRLLNGIDSEN